MKSESNSFNKLSSHSNTCSNPLCLSIAVCDDEPAELSYLQILLTDWANTFGHSLSVHCFSSGESFYFRWCEDRSFDILLLDIKMGKMSGMDLAQIIRKQDTDLPIIFITGFADYMEQGYDVDALHYLIKPVTAQKLNLVLAKAASRLKRQLPSLVIHQEGELLRLSVSDLLYLEAQGRITQIHTLHTGCLEVHNGIGQLEKQLPSEQFFRIHRSVLVNLAWVKRITHSEAQLQTGEILPLSRRVYKNACAALLNYLKLPLT